MWWMAFVNRLVIKLTDLNNETGFVPLRRVCAGLILDPDVITDDQRRRRFVCSDNLSVARICFGALPLGGEGLSPGWLGSVATRVNWNEVLDRTVKLAVCRE